jgi:hypothetical protein
MDEPRKVNPAAVEIIGTHGEVVQESKEKKREAKYQETPFGKVRVVQGGPWLLLLIPVVLPIHEPIKKNSFEIKRRAPL